ncbi:hypothetical protein ACVWXO_009289 [Bradyrhizobium sp. LM2.7]
MLARHVMNVLQDLDRFRSDVQSLSGTWHGTVSIACIESLTESVLPDLIASHRGRARRVSFTTEVKGSSDVLEALSRGEADIGIAMALRHPSDLRQAALKRFRLGAVVGREHPLARRKTVTLAQCLAFPVIHALPELSIYHLLQPLIAQLPETPEPAIQVNSIDLMRANSPRAGSALHSRPSSASAGCRARASLSSFRSTMPAARCGRISASMSAPNAPCPPTRSPFSRSWCVSSASASGKRTRPIRTVRDDASPNRQ